MSLPFWKHTTKIGELANIVIFVTTTDGDKPKRKLPTTPDTAAADAREQADEYESIFGNTRLDLNDGDFMMIPPHPDYGMLDDEKMDAWDELRFTVDTVYDREPDTLIPEQTLDGGLKLSAETVRGAIKQPFRITTTGDDGQPVTTLVKPAHSVKVVMVALGEDGYKQLREGGRNASDVWKIWGRQGQLIKERQQRDSKSARGAVDMAAVSPSDS